MQKKYLIYFFVTFIISILISLYAISANDNPNKIFSINGAYTTELNPFNTLSFDKESMTYYYYTSESNKTENSGRFNNVSAHLYLLKTGPLAGAKVKLSNKSVEITFNGSTETYKKISYLPTIIDN